MKYTRLFVGGLGDGVDNQLLTSKLSEYGTVTDIELKEKKDAEGNTTFKFAYVNIEGAPYHVEECVSQLNGALWSGSRLRVEVAKESFLDRLKREREKTQKQQQQASVSHQSESTRKLQKLITSNFHEFSHNDYKEQTLQVETGGKKKWRSLQDSDTAEVHTNKSVLPNEDVKSPKKKQKSNKTNDAEEKMMASFKTFSSVWADSDEEEDGSQHKKNFDKSENINLPQVHHGCSRVATDDERDPSDEDSDEDSDESTLNEERKFPLPVQDKRQMWGIPPRGSKHGTSESEAPYKTMMRYDPSRPEHQHFRILPSSQSKEVEQQSESHQEPEEVKSSGFSFLKMFDELQNNELPSSAHEKWSSQSIKKETVQEAEVDRAEQSNHIKEKEPNLEASECLPMWKSRSFFMNMKDNRIQEGLDWMMRNDQYHVIPEYQAVESDLYNVIKTRSMRARREARKEKIDNDNKRKSNKHKDTEISVTEDQYYDYAWRRAVQSEEARKSRGRGQTGARNQGRQGGFSQNQEEDQARDCSYGSRFREGNGPSRGRGRGDYFSGRGRGRVDEAWGRGRGDYVSGRGRGDCVSGRGRGDEAWGRGKGGTHFWGSERGDNEVRGRGRGGNHSWSRGRGDYHNKDRGHSWVKENGGDYATRG